MVDNAFKHPGSAVKPRLLVVEDEAIVGLELRLRLEDLGHEVVAVCRSAAAAREVLHGQVVDLVLLDIRLEGDEDGIALGVELRERDVPVVFLTAFSDRDTVIRAGAAEPYGYLVKPFSPRMLEATLATALQRIRLERARADAEAALRRSEAELRATTKRLTEILRDSPAGIYVCTATVPPRITFTNARFDELLGRQGVDFPSWLAAIHPDDREPPAAVRSRLEREGSVTLEYRLIQADGSWRWLRDHAILDRGSAGECAEISGFVIDITAQKEAEQAQRESEDRLREIAEHVNAVLWIAAPDFSEIFFVNRAFEDVWGRSRAEAYADPQVWADAVHPDDRAAVLATTAQSPHEHEYVHRLLRPGGDVRWVNVRVFPIRDSVGRTCRVAGLAEDVTAAREVEFSVARIRRSLEDAQRIARIGNWDWDIATNRLWWSEEVYRIFGMAAGEGMSYERFLAAVHPHDRTQVAAAVNQSHASGQPYSIVHRVVQPGGTTRVVEERGEVVFDGQGHPERMLGTVQDITEAQRAEETLRLLSRAVAQTAEHVFITDDQGRFLFANPAFEKLSGWRLEELRDCTPRVLKSDRHSPDFYQHMWECLRRGDVFQATFENRARDGRIYFEEKAITPMRDADGRITHFVSTGRDVTEKLMLERAQEEFTRQIRRSAEDWARTFDAVGFPMLVVDASGYAQSVNRPAREQLGWDSDSSAAVRLDALPGEPWRTLVGLAPDSGPVQVRDEAGRTWEVEAFAAASSVVLTARDVSEMLGLQESVHRLETVSVMGRLVAGVAHEVRNPLFAISAALDAFEAEFGAEPMQGYSRVLRQEVDRLSELMRDLLEFGRPTHAAKQRRPLQPVIDRAVRACSREATRRGVEIRRRAPEAAIELDMDFGRLVQVFQNVIENAVQHAPGGSHVCVQVARRDDNVEVEVHDRGPGFGGDVSRLFEPFFTRRRGGTGLGLSIVQRIVEQHGGRVTLENAPDGGGLVRLHLPLAESR